MQKILISGREAIFTLEIKKTLKEYDLIFSKLENISELIENEHYDLLILHDYHTKDDFKEIDSIRAKYSRPIIFISTFLKNKVIKFADVIVPIPYESHDLLEIVRNFIAEDYVVNF